MLDEIPQETDRTDLRIMRSIMVPGWRSLWKRVIYDADEESVLDPDGGHVLDQNTGEILQTFPDDTQVSGCTACNSGKQRSCFSAGR